MEETKSCSCSVKYRDEIYYFADILLGNIRHFYNRHDADVWYSEYFDEASSKKICELFVRKFDAPNNCEICDNKRIEAIINDIKNELIEIYKDELNNVDRLA